MVTTIRKMGNSQGVIIPKPLLQLVGLTDKAELLVEDGALVLRKPKAHPRAGWAESSRALAEEGDDALVWPEFANDDDVKLEW
jgi:antitoxin MazE